MGGVCYMLMDADYTRVRKNPLSSLSKEIGYGYNKLGLPTDFRHCKPEHYALLNEDEALQFIIDRALNHGWKMLGYKNKKKFPYELHYSIFDGFVSVFYDNNHQQIDVGTFTIDEMIADKQFMESYYGSESRSYVFSFDIHTGKQKQEILWHCPKLCWQVQQEMFKIVENKVEWLFLSIDK